MGWRLLSLSVGMPGLAAALFFFPPRAGAGELTLDEAERRWLAEHPVIEFGYDPDWAPFSYYDQAAGFSGLDADVLKVLGARLGVRFSPRHHADWSTAYRSAVAGEISVLTSTAATPERAALFRFTRAYVAFPAVILTRAEEPDFDDISLLAGRRVAAVGDYAPTLALRRDFPEIELVPCATVAEALQAVAARRADATITNLVNATHVMREHGITGLKVAGVGPYVFQLRFAVRRDATELHRILDAAVASLDAAERQALLAPYVRLDTGAVVSRARMLRWTLAAAVVLALVAAAGGWHHWRLRRELVERQRLQRELESSRDRLATLNEEKSGLMRMAAHDLRSPLTGLLMSVELLRMDDETTRRQGLDRMVMLIHQMMHMIRNLLDVQALEAGTRPVRPERVELSHALDEVRATFEPQARRKNIALRFAEAGPGLAVQADRSALRQVCDNLLSNALKYSPGGTSVRVAAARAEGGRVRLCVRDEGPGVRADEMARLFQRYTCLSARPTAGEPSTGLGLSIVKELVERMGGRVWCESEPGRGAAFLVELPEAAALPSGELVT